ncbi:MAG: HPP family protein [Candidatus Margulisbacteria bacterium]|nr:HPP family protein [Candidatus Margulisiibacteriota bacterium]
MEEIKRLLKKFTRDWKNYVVQSLMATLSVFFVMLALTWQDAVIIASLGATAFVVFAMPNNVSARTRNVIGGHLVGLTCGSLAALIPHATDLGASLVYSLAVGSSIFIMVVTDTEHPPASGTALGFAMMGFNLYAGLAVISASICLSFFHFIFRPYLKELV